MATSSVGVITFNTSSLESYTTASFTPATDDLLLVEVAGSGTRAAASCSDSDGGTYTEIGHIDYGSSSRAYYYVADQLASGSSITVTFDCTGDAATRAGIFVRRISGITRTGLSAILQSDTDTGAAGGTPTVVFPSSCQTGNSIQWLAQQLSNNGISLPTEGSFTEDQDSGTTNLRIEAAFQDSGFTGTTLTSGATTAGSYAVMGVEVDTSAASGGVTVEPAVVTAAGAVVTPTVVLGSVTITPTAVAAVGAVVAPTVVLGSITITPSVIDAVGAVIDPTVDIGGGGTLVTPAAIDAVGAVVDPTLFFGSLTASPAPVAAVGSVVNPSIVTGGGEILVPSVAEAASETTIEEILVGSGWKFGTQAPLSSVWTPDAPPPYSPYL